MSADPFENPDLFAMLEQVESTHAQTKAKPKPNKSQSPALVASRVSSKHANECSCGFTSTQSYGRACEFCGQPRASATLSKVSSRNSPQTATPANKSASISGTTNAKSSSSKFFTKRVSAAATPTTAPKTAATRPQLSSAVVEIDLDEDPGLRASKTGSFPIKYRNAAASAPPRMPPSRGGSTTSKATFANAGPRENVNKKKARSSFLGSINKQNPWSFASRGPDDDSDDEDGNDSFDEFAGPAVQMPHDAEAIKTWVYPTSESYPKREYQFSIVRAALLRNTLVVLPTGLGKTFIAAVVMFNIMRWFPTGKVIFVAPTKPLVSQQVEACHKIVGIDESLTGRMMGNIAASKRKEHWKTKRLFYCTPQTAENDCKTGLVPMEEVVCVVIDEAHRATGNYAFTNLIKELRSKTRNFRILALSATPGNDKARVQEVVDNLHVANLEYKAEMDPDVKPYVFNKLIQIIDVKSSGGMQDVETKLYDLAKPVYLSIQASSCCPPMLRRAVHKISPEMIVTARSWLYQNGTTAPVPAIRRVTAELGALSTLLTGIKYLAVEGVAGMLFHFEQTLAKTNINAVFERIAKTDRFRSFLGDLRLRRDDPDCNPKVAKLLEILTAHFRRMGEASQQTSCIVFAHSRATVASLVAVIEAQTDLRVSPFVGQRSTTSAKEKSKMKMAKASAALADEIDDDDDDDDNDAGENDENDDTGFLGNGGDENFGLPGQSRQSAATSKQGGKESVATKGQSQREQQAIINKFKAGALDILVATCIGEEGLDIGSVDLIVCFDSLKSPVRMVQRFGRAGRKRSGSVVLLVSHGKEKNDLTAGTERSNKIHRLLREKLGTLTLHHGSNPRMVPKGIVPQVEYKELEIGSFRASQVAGVTPKKRKSKGDDTDKSKKRAKNTWVELKTPLRPFSPRENKYYADFVQTSRKPAPDLFTFSLFNRRDKLILGSRRAAPSSSRSKAYERIKLYVDRRVWALSNEPCESPHPSVIDLDAAPNNAKEKETFDRLDRDASAEDERNMGHDTTTAEAAEAAADVNLFDEEAFIGGDDYNDDDDVKDDKDDAAHMSCAPSRPPSMSTLPPKFNLDADSQEDAVVHEPDNEHSRKEQQQQQQRRARLSDDTRVPAQNSPKRLAKTLQEDKDLAAERPQAAGPAQALETAQKPLQADEDVAVATSKSHKTPKSSSTRQEVKEGIVSASSATSLVSLDRPMPKSSIKSVVENDESSVTRKRRSPTPKESGHAENKEMEHVEMYKEREHWKPKFSVGDCVTIKRRPGRGFKPGGTARVTRVNKREQTYNLKYILEARSEKGVAEDQLVKGIEVDHVLTESSVKSPAHPVAKSGLEDRACGSARPRQAKIGKSYAEASTSPSQSRSESTGCTGPDASAGSPSISIVNTSPAEISQSPSKQGAESDISRQSASTPRLAIAVAEASPATKEGEKENSVKSAAPPNELAHSSVPAPAIVVPNVLNGNHVSGDHGVSDIDGLKQGSISFADDSDSDDVASLFEEDIAMPPVAYRTTGCTRRGCASDDICSCCGEPGSASRGKLLQCHGLRSCHVRVHARCVGTVVADAKTWQCAPCQRGSPERSCFLCPNQNGALVLYKDRAWVHAACSWWNPQISLTLDRDGVLRNIDMSRRLSLHRYSCSFCGRRVGACVECDVDGCSFRFHASCARDAGATLTFRYCAFHVSKVGESRARVARDQSLGITTKAARVSEIPAEQDMMIANSTVQDRGSTLVAAPSSAKTHSPGVTKSPEKVPLIVEKKGLERNTRPKEDGDVLTCAKAGSPSRPAKARPASLHGSAGETTKTSADPALAVAKDASGSESYSMEEGLVPAEQHTRVSSLMDSLSKEKTKSSLAIENDGASSQALGKDDVAPRALLASPNVAATPSSSVTPPPPSKTPVVAMPSPAPASIPTAASTLSAKKVDDTELSAETPRIRAERPRLGALGLASAVKESPAAEDVVAVDLSRSASPSSSKRVALMETQKSRERPSSVDSMRRPKKLLKLRKGVTLLKKKKKSSDRNNARFFEDEAEDSGGASSDENEEGADEDEDEDGNLKGLIDDSSQRSASRSDSDAAHSPDIYRRSLMESPRGLTGFGRRRFNMPIIDAHLRELNSRAIAGVNLESKNARFSKMGQVSSSASSPSSTSTSKSANSVVLGGGGKRLRHHKVMEDSSQSQDFGPTPIKGKALDSSSEETPEARNEVKRFRQRKVLADSSQSQDFGPTPTKLETAQMGRRKVLADSPQSVHLGPPPRESVPQAEHVQSTKNGVAESAAMKEMVVELNADVEEVSTRKADLSMNIESEPVFVPPSACNEMAVIKSPDNVSSGVSSSASLLEANTSVEQSSSREPAQLVWADAHAKRRDITAVCRQMRHGRRFDVKMVRDFSLQGADFVLGSRVGVCILSQRRLMQLASAPAASSSSSSSSFQGKTTAGFGSARGHAQSGSQQQQVRCLLDELVVELLGSFCRPVLVVQHDEEDGVDLQTRSEDTFAEKFFRAYMQAQSWSRVQTVMTSSVDETVQLLQHMSTVEEREGFGLRALGLASEDMSEAHMRVIKFIMLLPGANLAVARRLIAQNVGRTLQDVLETLKAKSVMEQVPGLSMQMAGLMVTSLLRRSK